MAVVESELNQQGIELEIEPSDLSLDLLRLKASVETVVAKRERLPQPLFWSLFFSEIQRLKREKEASNFLKQLLFR